MNSNYSYEWDSKYCYPNSDVLKNKFNIRDSKKLELAEREYTSLTIAEIKVNPIKGNFDLKHLQDIHKHLFRDIYDWAGELRTVNISKGTHFYNYMYIVDGAKTIFNELKKENYLIGLSKEKIYGRLGYYLSEINVLHPFREGNGRSQRVIIEYLAQVAGYNVDFSKVSGIEMIKACIDSFNCDYDKMTEIFAKIINPIDNKEQEEFINKIALKNSPILKAYETYFNRDLIIEDEWEMER
ncbi:Fic/DOC family protein [Tissierellaceae bacterium HCP3S3_D8]